MSTNRNIDLNIPFTMEDESKNLDSNVSASMKCVVIPTSDINVPTVKKDESMSTPSDNTENIAKSNLVLNSKGIFLCLI